MCQCLKTVEEEGHIVSGQCEVYGDLRSQFGDLQEDKNLVQYFQAVLDRRDILEEVDRRQQSSTAAVGASLIRPSPKGRPLQECLSGVVVCLGQSSCPSVRRSVAPRMIDD